MSESPLYALGILLLAASLYRQDKDGPLLKELVDWVVEEGDRLNSQQEIYGTAPYRWLVGVSWGNMGEEGWSEASRQILLEPAKPRPPEADEILRLIGRMVAGGTRRQTARCLAAAG